MPFSAFDVNEFWSDFDHFGLLLSPVILAHKRMTPFWKGIESLSQTQFFVSLYLSNLFV